MDNEQAKLILSAYRPGGADAADPFFADALEQARRDPGLNRWFENRRDFDLRMRDALASEQPPSGLRDTILLGAKVAAIQQPARHGGFWRRPASWLALAAALAMALVVVDVLSPGAGRVPRHGMSTSQLGDEIRSLIDGEHFQLGKMSGDTTEIRAWLAAQGSPHDFPIPDAIASLDKVGCQTLTVHGSKISLLCFQIDDTRIAHLVVIDQEALDAPPGPEPEILHHSSGIAAAWSTAGRSYLLTGKDLDEDAIRKLI